MAAGRQWLLRGVGAEVQALLYAAWFTKGPRLEWWEFLPESMQADLDET